MPSFNIEDHVSLMVLAGSRAYGMDTSTSDVDVRGVVVPPVAVMLGLYNQGFTEADSANTFAEGNGVFEILPPDLQEVGRRTKVEGCLTEARKFAGMAMGANPTILDVLFCKDEHVLFRRDHIADFLRSNRDMVLSQKAMHSFTGYAAAQLKKIVSHRQWVTKGDIPRPTRAQFGLPEVALANVDVLEAIVKLYTSRWHIDLSFIAEKSVRDMLGNTFRQTLTDIVAPYVKDEPTFVGNVVREDHIKRDAATRRIGLDDNLMEVLAKEREYRSAMDEYEQYQQYLRDRSKSRLALESVHGYDTKHAAHLIRLLRMGMEVMTLGEVRVWREDAKELLAIRNGERSFESITDEARQLEADIRSLPKERIVVPYAPDRNFIKKLDDLILDSVVVI
jgi:predicted nucleotidyltransferase